MVDGIFDTLSTALTEFAVTVVDLLPDSPFSFLDTFAAPAEVVMGYVNWFVDIGTISAIFTGWLACILLWYGYGIVLRWIKVIG